MKNEILSHLGRVAATFEIPANSLKLDYPENPEHGDFSSNLAMAHAKKLGMSPKELAEKIIAEFTKDIPASVESVSIAGPGFINFKIKNKVFAEEIISIVKSGAEYGWSTGESGKKIMVEYTDPNPFKIFHIGHLMANSIGESLSRLIQAEGVEVVRACYQGDVGLHVAKTIWAMRKEKGEERMKEITDASVTEKVKWLGEMYVYGSQFDADKELQKEIQSINKKIFEKSDPEINALYEKGRAWSLEYFDLIYKRLGTKFDKFFFESEVAGRGTKIVKEFLGKGVFSESEGAVVFKGEDHGLHTRVFITSHGLPTYEAKELALNTEKFELYPDLSQSIIVTANEINDYFQVLLKTLSLINPNVAEKTTHISHGILRFTSGKMSSRKGNVISAESLLSDIREMVQEKIINRGFAPEEAEEISDIIAIGAIKYTILRQAIGGDVIFDSAASVSFEGDSGPYLQYSTVRANSVLEKAAQQGIEEIKSKKQDEIILPEQVSLLEKLITRFPDILERSRKEYAPQHVANYLINLAGAFNSYYANNTIADKNEPLAPYRVALTRAFVTTMTNGLWVLGIKVPKKM
ncbi:MAG: arginine--tRNA ligase [Patescibacteria group bacterium]